jgi:hypothetical protein
MSHSLMCGDNPRDALVRTFPQALDKGEGFVKDRIVLSGVGDTAFRQSSVEEQELQASR